MTTSRGRKRKWRGLTSRPRCAIDCGDRVGTVWGRFGDRRSKGTDYEMCRRCLLSWRAEAAGCRSAGLASRHNRAAAPRVRRQWTGLPIAGLVRANQGYPPYLPGGNFKALLFEHEALGARIVEIDGPRRRSGRTARPDATTIDGPRDGRPRRSPEQLGLVATLLVAPDYRRMAAGRALLETAAGAAGRERPVSD